MIRFANQLALTFFHLAFHPDTDGDHLIGQLGVQYSQAQQPTLDHRNHIPAHFAFLVTHLAQALLDAFSALAYRVGSLALQATQVFALQRVVLAEFHPDLEFSQMNAVVQQLGRTVQTRNHARHTGPQNRLQSGAGGVERADQQSVGLLQAWAHVPGGFVAGHYPGQG
ncbi:hypothetical protein D9M71_660570 [compost metagenome]